MVRRRKLVRLAWGCLLFSAGFVLPLAAVSLNGDAIKASGTRVVNTPVLKDPGPCCFYANPWGYELSQPVLYHALGDSIDNARKADILFIGNSRLQLGIREEFILPLAKQHGLRVFSIGSGHSERAAFPLELIRRHDLRPKVLVVVGGPHVWNHRFSEVAAGAMAMSRWDARKLWLETALSWRVRRALHRLVPRVAIHRRGITSAWATYRSEDSGWWVPAREPIGAHPTAWVEPNFNRQRVLDYARGLKAEMDRRGTLLVSTVIPYGDTIDAHLPMLERELGIVSVDTGLKDLKTADGSHLNRESARRFTEAFWAAFVSSPEVRRRLDID